jgi:hypothetical protein
LAAAYNPPSSLYAPGAFLDSQTGDYTYVDRLIGSDAESQSQQVSPVIVASKFLSGVRSPQLIFSGEEIQGSRTLSNCDHEFELQQLKIRLRAAIGERDDFEEERNEYRAAFDNVHADREQLRKKLQKWEDAAAAASALVNLAHTHTM